MHIHKYNSACTHAYICIYMQYTYIHMRARMFIHTFCARACAEVFSIVLQHDIDIFSTTHPPKHNSNMYTSRPSSAWQSVRRLRVVWSNSTAGGHVLPWDVFWGCCSPAVKERVGWQRFVDHKPRQRHRRWRWTSGDWIISWFWWRVDSWLRQL